MAKSIPSASGEDFTAQNEELLDELEEGDLIELPRGALYSHWAVYVGKGDVVHLTGDTNSGNSSQSSKAPSGSLSGKSYDKAKVKREKFWDAVGNSRALKNNTKDSRFQPLPKKEIVRTALNLVGKVGYNLLLENCEHFASYCRYGKAISDQVNKLLVALGLRPPPEKARSSREQDFDYM